jgi:hypothetical protein
MKPPLLVRRTFYGRTFSVQELELMRQVASDCAALGVTEIARTLCELLDWKRPSGRLKNHECRQLLEHLRDEGWLQLPSLRQVGPRGPRRIDRSKRGEPQPEITVSAGDLEPLILTLVKPGPESTFWNELIDRYHYLGYRVPVGAHLRYFVRSAPLGEPILACLQWSSAAWKIKARDRWIGWTDQQRARNLQCVLPDSPARFSPTALASSLVTGSVVTAASRFCWNPLLMLAASLVPVIGPQIGFFWAKHADGVEWIDVTSLRVPHLN